MRIKISHYDPDPNKVLKAKKDPTACVTWLVPEGNHLHQDFHVLSPGYFCIEISPEEPVALDGEHSSRTAVASTAYVDDPAGDSEHTQFRLGRSDDTCSEGDEKKSTRQIPGRSG